MNNFLFNQKTPTEIIKNLVLKIQDRRKKLKISQVELAQKSGVSLGSVKRFESKYEISLSSLIKIAIALDLDKDFDNLFNHKSYTSIDEVING
ncbi:MAG: XRE family transcriptional regulator [Candidatus Melainabacteria bacterium]|nr:MAG: XRE family transcriptional regulator [Candidatus Melainabacteria bacterium]